MSNLENVIKQLKELPKVVSSLAVNVLTDDEILIYQNRLEQGKYADGKDFPDYAPLTVQLKRLNGGFISQSGKIALKDTGEFYDSMKLRKEKDFAEITSDNEKAGKLVEAYGDEIFDVSDEEATEMAEQKEVEIAKEIEKFLFQ